MTQSDRADFFRHPLVEMIDLCHPSAALTNRLTWAQSETALAPHFFRQVREGRAVAQNDLLGLSLAVAGAGIATVGRPRLLIRLMACLLYLSKRSTNRALERVEVS